mgnify:CR=1 FL=1
MTEEPGLRGHLSVSQPAPYLRPSCVHSSELLGQGGFGSVYKAVRDGDYEELVAIKVLRSDRQNQSVLVKRFEQERQMLAELHHENISRILDGGQTYDGSPYFVMEYIEG